jgi:hypothetical protein
MLGAANVFCRLARHPGVRHLLLRQAVCTSLAEAIGGSDALSTKLAARKAMLADEALLSASLFCFGVTFVNVIPVLLLVVVAVTMAAYPFYARCVLLPKLFALMTQALTYLHTE